MSVPGNPSSTMQDQGGFVVELEQFSGPLDLLLHLIREDEVDITDLPIARIADQFLAAIADLGLNQAADYLEMAARLLRIKAQLLLPRRLGDDEWEDPRSELVRRLLEYQQIRELVDWLHHAAQQRADRFGRGFAQPAPDLPPPPSASSRSSPSLCCTVWCRGRWTSKARPRGSPRCSPSAKSSGGSTWSGPGRGWWRSCRRSSPCSSSPSVEPARCSNPNRSPPW